MQWLQAVETRVMWGGVGWCYLGGWVCDNLHLSVAHMGFDSLPIQKQRKQVKLYSLFWLILLFLCISGQLGKVQKMEAK